MKKKNFEDLLLSVKQGAEILRGQASPQSPL